MSVNQPDPSPTRLSAATAVIWRSVQVAIAVVVVVVPFAYAVTGVHREVLISAGCGFAIGVGLMRLGPLGGRSTGILIGSAVGILAALAMGVSTDMSGALLIAAPVGAAVPRHDRRTRAVAPLRVP